MGLVVQRGVQCVFQGGDDCVWNVGIGVGFGDWDW